MAAKLKAGVVAQMAPGDLERDPKQPRQTFNEETLRSLGESMKVKQDYPILVRQDGKRTIITDGERRWRAAKLVKIAKVDVLLDDRTDALDVAAAQLTTAVQREDLSPLDIAEFLVGLRKRQGATTNTLLAELNKRGIKEIGPAKVDRIMRLVELPDWAKDLMREGKLNESHGHAIVNVLQYPEVMKHVREQVSHDLKWTGQIILRELERDIEHGFRLKGIDLNHKHGKPEETRQFPIEQCRSCEFYKKIGGAEYCLNRKLFDKKNKEALLLQATKEAEKAEREKKRAAAAKQAGKSDAPELDPMKVEPRKVKLSDENVVPLKRLSWDTRRSLDEANFDQAQCKTCPHRHLGSSDGKAKDAVDHCFYVPCFNEKTRLDSRDQSRRGKMREYLEAWLRPVVVREAPKRLDANEQLGILLWLATGAVDRGSLFYGGQMHERAARATVPFLQTHKLLTLPELMEFATTKMENTHYHQLVAASIQVMTQDQLRWLALRIKIDLNDPAFAYRVDEGFLRMKRKGELAALWRDSGMDVESIAALGAEELRRWCLEANAKKKIGVPAELEALYREPFDLKDDPLELDEDDLVDEDEGTVCIGCGCTYLDPCEPPCAWVVQGDRPSYMSKDPQPGVCSAEECAPHMERWRRGDRELSKEAKARVKERRAMLKGQDDDELQKAAPGIEALLEGEKPARKKRRA